MSGIVATLSISLGSFGLLHLTNLKLTHSLYKEREVASDIVIVGVDEASIAHEDTGGLGEIETWSYSIYERVLDEINNGNASVIMFDFLFSDTSKSIPNEEVIDLSMQNLTMEDFIGEIFKYLESPSPLDKEFINTLKNSSNTYLAKLTHGPPTWNGESHEFSSSILPADQFLEASDTGYINYPTEENKTIYEAPDLISVDGKIEKHIDIKIAESHLNKELNDIPSEKGRWLINYAGKVDSYPIYSFVDVYNGRVDPSIFENKIVLIGPTAVILQDYFYTPIDSNGPMAGIEIHANAIQTILDQEFLEYQDAGAFIALITVLTLVSVFAFLHLPIWAGLIVLVLELIAFPFYAQMRFDQGVIINLIWPVFAIGASYFLVMAYRNFTDFREKRKIKNAFAHYVSPALVNQIAASGEKLELGGERRYMTTLFLDIENFTSLSEKLEAHDVVKVINTYFDAFAKEIMAHGGTVDKFEGDAIMALFGAPIKSEDHALKATQTAMAIRSRVGELNQETGNNLNVRVGIATGDCIVGNMGSEQRFDYTAMGDTVNTASRLEGGNKFYGTRILVNPQTMEGAQDTIFFRRIDRVQLKGKEEAIDIYEVMGMKEAVSEAGKLLVNEWHSMLEYYRNQNWIAAEEKLNLILEKMPNDGPAQTYMKRIQELKTNPRNNWDGVWRFTSK